MGPLLLREPQLSLVPASFLGARTICWHQHGVWRFLDTRDQRLMHRDALTQRKCFSDAGGQLKGQGAHSETDTHTQTDIQRCTQAHTTDAQADTQRSHRHMHRGAQTHTDTHTMDTQTHTDPRTHTERRTHKHTDAHTRAYPTLFPAHSPGRSKALTELLLVGPQVEGDAGAGQRDTQRLVLEGVT